MKTKRLGGGLVALIMAAGLGCTEGRQFTAVDNDPLTGGVPLPPSNVGKGSRVEAGPAKTGLSPGPAPSTPGGLTTWSPKPAPKAAAVADKAPELRPAGNTTAAPTYNYEQLQTMLKERRVVMQHLQSLGTGDEWHFTCAIPDTTNPQFRVNYEATAPGPHGLAAIKKAIDLIDEKK
jgi:hypothetical protein